jgi:hypothetical protein
MRGLLHAAIGHAARRVKLEIPDTGSLRGDVLALMRQFSDPDATLLTMVSVHLGGNFQETGTSPVELIALLAPELPLVARSTPSTAAPPTVAGLTPAASPPEFGRCHSSYYATSS